MSLADRRAAIRMAVGAALLPVLAVRPALAQITSGNVAITPPDCEMLYRRTLKRQMAGGAWVEITRDFSVFFERSGSGFQLLGRQIAAHVQAPPNLAQLAELEEQRVETGIFPLLLDSNGLIVDGKIANPSVIVQEALRHVQRLFEGQGNEVSDLVEVLHNSGAQMTAELPRDLFAPEEASREQRQEITLPWGDRGVVLTHFQARRDPQTQLMFEAQRDIVTRLGEDERHSSESWNFLPA